ncbi:MAG: hypothetical protein K2H73_04085, partial [Treponemataceae bacterium]|nr:hypothetical protein [Treponemataceae bacterium]
SAKTEQFSTFQTDQSKIEEGILKALERLNAVESTVLSVAAQAALLPAGQQEAVVSPAPVAEQPVVQQQETEIPAPGSAENGIETAFDEGAPITPDISFDDAEITPEQPEDTSQGQFDIF